LPRRDYCVVLTHGNGPQVGAQLLRSELSSAQVAPESLDVCGADASRGGCPNYTPQTCPFNLPIAGDPTDNDLSPSYSAFAPLMPAVAERIGERIGAVFTWAFGGADPGSSQGYNAALATAPTTIEIYDAVSGHNVPRAFWSYMRAQPADWLYLFERPISEAYWTHTKIGGVEQWVLVQLFERRTLTYTPANAPAWQVEMGNVGQHYYLWRYGPAEVPPWVSQ
jgi:hypothetical protein